MAMNLRLSPEAEVAVRTEAMRTGRSQQQLIREAVDRYLGLAKPPAAPQSEAEVLLATGAVLPPRSAFRDFEPPARLKQGVTTQSLLDRDERV